MNVLRKGIQAYFFLLAALFFAGCGTVYVNPPDRNLSAAERESFAVARSVDGAYRQVYGRLQDCVSAYGYRVRGNITRERDAADVTVDSGFGFERTLYLADAIFLKAELERLAPDRTRITFILADANARPFAVAARRWLLTGEGPCRA